MKYYESDDEPLALSSHALEALAEFNAERDARVKDFEMLKAQVEERVSQGPVTIESFTEDWNESQFWYTRETADALASELLDGAEPDTKIAVVSAPSVFVAMKNLLADWAEDKRPKVVLLEHDQRFAVFGDEFVFYDYNTPFALPAHLKGSIDRVVLDPPFLNEACQTKAAMTIRWMLGPTSPSRLLIATGERMQPLILRLYKPYGVATSTFIPEHARELGNIFRCYANYKSPRWSWMETVGLD